ncbi:hypothetical protein [Croceicoccus sp. BE223]|uniref:hypothetical protein n=1 Tax=Croceicoccus sp. BE223 TaxID=2817716 RepID=UPI002860AD74|nr:hypothetical protein [Croceicoccus sp. BE223]MDR7103134.1 hypothetical protein [Croceicoccus sp. BE223]
MSDIAASGIDTDRSGRFRFTAWFAPDSAGIPDMSEAVRDADLVIVGDGATADIGLIADGLDFAISPAPVGDAGSVPAMRFDAPDHLFEGASAVRLAPSLPDVGDEAPMAVIRAACRVALALAAMPGCVAIGWAAADSAMGSGYFGRTVRHWLAGGPFPALGLTSMALDEEGNMVSRGLNLIIGQELRVLAAPGQASADRARIAIRMIDHLVRHGTVHEAEVVEIEGYGTFAIEPAGDFINLAPSPFA